MSDFLLASKNREPLQESFSDEANPLCLDGVECGPIGDTVGNQPIGVEPDRISRRDPLLSPIVPRLADA